MPSADTVSAAYPSPPLISLHAVGLSHQKRDILNDVNLDLVKGEIVTLIGPNGAGKTSLVKLALGLSIPTRGSVTRRPGLRVGYVPQNVAIDEILPLSVGRFLTLGVAAPRARVMAMLAELGIEALYHSPVQAVSGGEFRRVLLARALLREIDLLVLDEPTQGVDVTGQAEFYRHLRRIRDERGCGILIVSHDLHLVMASTDQVVCLDHHVCCQGAPEAVSRNPAFRKLFGDQTGGEMALYTHDLTHDHTHSHEGHDHPHDHHGNDRGHEGGH